ncbi:hypothetical protein ABS71_01585 [bacterium SCN 62-11]|nr:MAG: hypothetical protein ABS71_01585 [bacterium SCN 62-11]
MAEASYQEVAEHLRAGRQGSLEAFIQRTQSDCSRVAYSILRDPELTRDALQETYLLVFRKIDQLREPAQAKSWLLRILTRCCQHLLRRRGAPPAPEPDDEPPDPQQPDLEETVWRRQELRATFAQLNDQDQTILALREICSLSYEELSEVLGIPVGTVRSRLSKARLRFTQSYRGAHSHD